MKNRPVLILPSWNGFTNIAFPQREREREREREHKTARPPPVVISSLNNKFFY